MANMKFEQAQQIIAQKYGYDSFLELIFGILQKFEKKGTQPYYDEAAELMANEAVKEDRNRIIEANPTNIYENGLGDVYSCINMIKLNKIPLPYADHNKG